MDVVVVPETFGSALRYATGNRQHLEPGARAHSNGLILSSGGLGKPGARPTGRTEQAIYRRLGLSYIPPELREGDGEVAQAKARTLPKLIEARDLKGVLHVHTDASDGTNTLLEMAEAARDLGYQYLGVTDHSISAHYAGGLSIDDILRQHDLVDALNEEFSGGFRILKGIKVPTSWPTARWIIQTISSTASISWWQAWTAPSA